MWLWVPGPAPSRDLVQLSRLHGSEGRESGRGQPETCLHQPRGWACPVPTQPHGGRPRGCWADGTPSLSVTPPRGHCRHPTQGPAQGAAGIGGEDRAGALGPPAASGPGLRQTRARGADVPLPATHAQDREPQDRGPGLERASRSGKLGGWSLVWLCRCRETGLERPRGAGGSGEGGDSGRCHLRGRGVYGHEGTQDSGRLEVWSPGGRVVTPGRWRRVCGGREGLAGSSEESHACAQSW